MPNGKLCAHQIYTGLTVWWWCDNTCGFNEKIIFKIHVVLTTYFMAFNGLALSHIVKQNIQHTYQP